MRHIINICTYFRNGFVCFTETQIWSPLVYVMLVFNGRKADQTNGKARQGF